MANNKGMKIPHDKAIAILDVLEGRTEPEDAKQEAFILKVQKIYFSWTDASDDYIQNNAEMVIPSALGFWAVDSQGVPTRPDSHHSWLYSKQHKFWVAGKPSKAVQFYIDKIRNERSYKRNTLGGRK